MSSVRGGSPLKAVPVAMDFSPGITRDGTQFDAVRCLDALWARWRLGRVRKMNGFIQITDTLKGVPRRIHIFYTGSYAYVHIGTTSAFLQVVLDYNGNLISINDRTPTAFMAIASPTVGWTIDAIFDTNTGVVQLVAHAVPDTGFPNTLQQTVPYLGPVTATTILVQFSDPVAYGGGAWTQPNIAGGVVCVQPYVFDFDANGLVQWSPPNIALGLGITGGTTGAGQARISAQKVMAGLPLRGGGTQQPAVLFWTVSEVVTGVFVGSNAGFFAFSTVSSSSSIISTEAAIEYDGIYYWCGIDRFLMFNGTVSEIPNSQNQDWFFKNLTFAFSGRIQAYKVPRYGEIWWLAPMFGNSECSHAIIYNVRENYWYDTVLPNGGRGAGYFAQGLRFPIMTGNVADANGYSLWIHEEGFDQVTGMAPNKVTTAVRSYFETPWMGGPKEQVPSNKGISAQQLEPDFEQTGDMFAYLIGAANARSTPTNGPVIPIKGVPTVPQEQFASFKESHRLVRLHIESNVAGGNYTAGRNLFHVEPSEERLFP